MIDRPRGTALRMACRGPADGFLPIRDGTHRRHGSKQLLFVEHSEPIFKRHIAFCEDLGTRRRATQALSGNNSGTMFW